MNSRSPWLWLTVVMLLATGYYLWPTVKASRMTAQELAATPEERALKLGLDLRGGMAVTMEVRVDELIRALASNTDEAFNRALQTATNEAKTSTASMVSLFVDAYEQQNPDGRLARYFRSDVDRITRNSSNADVATYLQAQADGAVNRAIEIVRQRIDRFGVSEPSIVKKGTSRISVELPGVADGERVRRLLRGTARLEFRTMADPAALSRSLSSIVQFYNGRTDTARAAADTTARPDSSALATSALPTTPLAGASTADSNAVTETPLSDTAKTAAATPASTDSASRARADSAALAEAAGANNVLLKYLEPAGQGVTFGLVSPKDTARVHQLLRRPEVAALLPPGVELLYTSRPAMQGSDKLALLGVRKTVELTGEALTDATVQFDHNTNAPMVEMRMDGAGAQTWSRLTGANIGKPVAIVLDDYVVSYPTVQNRISGGVSSITGLDGRPEADDIVTVLKSGSLPAPVQIINERTVGPSLGAESTRNGMLSLFLGFVIVSIFMIVWYRTAGAIAAVSLVFNLLILFAVLAAFGATLTLPGIAGIVLTMGMAVDANVLIYERIREELTAGKTPKAALEAGFSNALSAIIDSNVTTFLTGAILYTFGVGPIQGFAVTLMAGIVTSLFSALVVTRMIMTYFVDRNRAISVG